MTTERKFMLCGTFRFFFLIYINLEKNQTQMAIRCDRLGRRGVGWEREGDMVRETDEEIERKKRGGEARQQG